MPVKARTGKCRKGEREREMTEIICKNRQVHFALFVSLYKCKAAKLPFSGWEEHKCGGGGEMLPRTTICRNRKISFALCRAKLLQAFGDFFSQISKSEAQFGLKSQSGAFDYSPFVSASAFHSTRPVLLFCPCLRLKTLSSIFVL